MTENKRDYSQEYEKRKARNKRLFADLEKGLIDEFKSHLKAQGLTYTKWLKIQIEKELDKGQK